MQGISFSRRTLRFLAWPGLALATAGLVSGGLTGWQLLPTGLLVLGLGLLLVGLSFSGGAFWQQRSTQAGTNAALAVVAMLVILGLVNFLGVRYSSRIDLTENQIFTLAPATQQLTADLDQPVKVV
ncbi:MAG: ABC transporter, partial [Cyanobacteria bacterium]|nr:ABC transporter [Cyanobacteriota bacterium]